MMEKGVRLSWWWAMLEVSVLWLLWPKVLRCVLKKKGHKFAGNVICYIHKGQTGIWYGRVKSCHCRSIVEETILNGKVIKDLYRGCMSNSFKESKCNRIKWWNSDCLGRQCSHERVRSCSSWIHHDLSICQIFISLDAGNVLVLIQRERVRVYYKI